MSVSDSSDRTACSPAAQAVPEYIATERVVRNMEGAIGVFRWAALAWVILHALSWQLSGEGFRRPTLVIAAVTGVTAWTLWLTTAKAPLRGKVLLFDAMLGAALNLVSGLTVQPGKLGIATSTLALSYPYSAVLAAGTALGPLAGSLAGGVMAASYWVAHLVNGAPLTEALMSRLLAGSAGYLFAGLMFGTVSSLLRRSSEEVRAATAEAIAAREKAARLSERESMARQIHDSVLQVLALIHKRGTQLAESQTPDRAKVAELAEMAKDQEAALRGLIMREPEDAPVGEASLRSALEEVAAGIKAVDVSVSTVGPVWLPRGLVDELVDAVREALANVIKHSGATKAAIFADEQDGMLQLSVRDDGAGFVFDEAKFRQEGKFGMLNSMGGRVDAMGGSMKIDSRLGSGTEVEFQVPLQPGK